MRAAAVDLLVRFFREEGFMTPPPRIAENLDRMLSDSSCWCALAVADGEARAVITVSTVLYVEWGRLGEIGDLYVLPEYRRRGLAPRLVAAAKDWCRAKGCSARSPLRPQTNGATGSADSTPGSASEKPVAHRRWRRSEPDARARFASAVGRVRGGNGARAENGNRPARSGAGRHVVRVAPLRCGPTPPSFPRGAWSQCPRLRAWS
jgi:GNAT superfamily N-acetyltransferase